MRSLFIVIPFVITEWTLCADAAAKRGGGRAFPAIDDKRGGARVFQLNDDDKRGGGRIFQLNDDDKRGGGRVFQLNDDDKRGGGRVFKLNGDDKRGGGRAFDISSDKRGGGRSFPVMVGEDSKEKRAFDASFEKRAGGRAFFLYDRNLNNNLIKRPGARPVSSFVGNDISPYSLIANGWYRRKRPGARPFFGDVYAKKGGGRGFVFDSDEYSD